MLRGRYRVVLQNHAKESLRSHVTELSWLPFYRLGKSINLKRLAPLVSCN